MSSRRTPGPIRRAADSTGSVRNLVAPSHRATNARGYGSRRSPGRRWSEVAQTSPSMLPCPHIPKQKPRHFPLLDFLAAFGNAVAAVVAVDVLERLVARIAHAAMDLHGAVGGFAAQPVRPEIAHRDPVGERVLDSRLGKLVHLPRRLADQ